MRCWLRCQPIYWYMSLNDIEARFSFCFIDLHEIRLFRPYFSLIAAMLTATKSIKRIIQRNKQYCQCTFCIGLDRNLERHRAFARFPCDSMPISFPMSPGQWPVSDSDNKAHTTRLNPFASSRFYNATAVRGALWWFRQSHSVNYYANHQHSPFARRHYTMFQPPFSPVSFGKSFMKIRSAVPENGCLIFFGGRKKNKKKQKSKKNICKHIRYRSSAVA